MHRRRLLGLVAGAAGLAGCSARALPGGDPGRPTPATGCPAVLDVDRRVCPGQDGGPLAVERSGATVSGDRWSLVVSVANRTAEPIGTNPSGWSVFRRSGGRWRPVTSDARIGPWLELAPGERYTWQLTAGADQLGDVDQRVFLELPPGAYAFAVPFHAAERVGAVAPFDVVG